MIANAIALDKCKRTDARQQPLPATDAYFKRHGLDANCCIPQGEEKAGRKMYILNRGEFVFPFDSPLNKFKLRNGKSIYVPQGLVWVMELSIKNREGLHAILCTTSRDPRDETNFFVKIESLEESVFETKMFPMEEFPKNWLELTGSRSGNQLNDDRFQAAVKRAHMVDAPFLDLASPTSVVDDMEMEQSPLCGYDGMELECTMTIDELKDDEYGVYEDEDEVLEAFYYNSSTECLETQ